MSFDDEFENITGAIGSDEPEEVVNARSETSIEEPVERKNVRKIVEPEIIDGLMNMNIDDVLHQSMIPYSEHVILERALPRVEDGLKPVQRRILYSMLELGITPDKEFKKSARIVGDCMGKYHPHGDSSIYDAMVRMAQDFNMRGCLVSGHGNFGSVDGDPAAAMRYTEAKLSPLAMELLKDLDKNTVNWCLNYDDTTKEPVTLPGRFPNLLVNGTNGIAVGLATNIPPHNLTETINGVIAYIDNPKIKLDALMKIIKGPDFPTGAYLVIGDELKKAYETGKGKVIMRANLTIEDEGERKNIVITEFPYQTNKAQLLESINKLKEEKYKGVLSSIATIRDESDRTGTRAVLKLKKDANIPEILEILYKNTNLQCTFGINMVVIAEGKPMQLGLIDIIRYYVNYQREVILRRAKFELDEAKDRMHILQGLIVAIKNIDEVIKIVKKSPSVTEARAKLRARFNLSERQAQAILDMKISRLTNLEVEKLEKEIAELDEKIKRLTKLIGSKTEQYNLIKTELTAIKKQFGEERKTKIVNSIDDISISDKPIETVITEEYVTASYASTLKRVTQKSYSLATREWSLSSTSNEANRYCELMLNDKNILVFTNFGYCYRIDVKNIPDCKWRDKGTHLSELVKLNNINEKIIGVVQPDEEYAGSLVFFTKQGLVKITDFLEYNLQKTSFQAIKLKEGDELISVMRDRRNTTLVFVTSDGMVLNAGKDEVPSTGRVSSGVKGVNLNEDCFVVYAGLCQPTDNLVIASSKANVKKVSMSEFDLLSRYRKGVKGISLDSTSSVVYANVENNQKQLILSNSEENFAINFKSIAKENRTSKGKEVKKLFNVSSCFEYND